MEHQDKCNSAAAKSLEAAYASWAEDLRADQAQFCAERITRLAVVVNRKRKPRLEKEAAKARAKLVRQLEDGVGDMDVRCLDLRLLNTFLNGSDASGQDCHTRAWSTVGKFLSDHMRTFSGKLNEAIGTVMPACRSWIRETATEHGNSPSDHCIILIANCPAIGSLSAGRTAFLMDFVSNVLSDWPLNSICLLVHPNRAGHTPESRTAAILERFSGNSPGPGPSKQFNSVTEIWRTCSLHHNKIDLCLKPRP